MYYTMKSVKSQGKQHDLPIFRKFAQICALQTKLVGKKGSFRRKQKKLPHTRCAYEADKKERIHMGESHLREKIT